MTIKKFFMTEIGYQSLRLSTVLCTLLFNTSKDRILDSHLWKRICHDRGCDKLPSSVVTLKVEKLRSSIFLC